MADIAGPIILSATRFEGRSIRIQYEAGASGYNLIAADVRELTGSWAQGNQMTLLNGLIFVAGRAGVPLDPKKSYQVMLRARHSSGLPVAESSVANVGPWVVGTPTLLSVTRPFPTQAALTYEGAPVGEGAVLYVERRTTPSGTWAQATSFTPHGSGAGTYTIQLPSAAASYEVRIFAGQYGVSSDRSAARSINAWETAKPSLTSVTRTGEATASVKYDDAIPGTVMYVRRVSDAGQQTTVQFAPQTKAGTYTLTGLVGASSYEVWLYTLEAGIKSADSATKLLEAWFTVPVGVTDLVELRRADGTVDLAWSGVATTRAPYVGQRVYRADGDLGQFEPLPAGAITGSRRSFHDATAKAELEYRYMVAPFNDAGEATSRPVVKSAASVLVPVAPGSVTATYVSDSSADVSWPDSATPDKPVTTYRIRRKLNGGGWAPVKDVPGSQLSWRDPGLSPNGVYRYQVQALNAAGASVAFSPESAEVVTTPAGASQVSAVRVGSDIKVSWLAPSDSIASSWSIEQTTAADPSSPSAEWFPVSAGTLPGSARQFVHTSVAGGVPHTYRVRPTRAGAPDAQWVLSVKVSPYAPPNAPGVRFVGGIDGSAAVRVEWTHNPTDGTEQTSASVQYRRQGTGTWTTRTVTGAQGFYDIPAGAVANGQTLEVRVATKGQHASLGVYSAPVTQLLRARPTAALTAPVQGSVSASSVLRVAWSTSSQSEYRVRLLDAVSNVVDVRQGTSSSVREVTFEGLVDRGGYTVEVVVSDGFQSSLPAVAAFTVELDRPAPPTLTATPSPSDGSVLLTATAVQGLRVTRRNFTPPVSGWRLRNGDAVARGMVTVGGSDQAVMILAPGQFVQSPQFSVAAGDFESVNFYAYALSLDGAGEAAILYVYPNGDDYGAEQTVPVGAETKINGDILAEWPTNGRVAVENTGATTLYLWNVVGLARIWGAGGSGIFDGDTRTEGYVYGWNADGTAYEAVPTSDPAQADMPVAQTTRIEILRSTGSGWTSLGNVGPGGQLTDPLPPLGVPVTYKARAWTAAPAYADSNPQTVTLTGAGVFINWGPGWGTQAVMIGNLNFDLADVTDVELVHFDRDMEGPNLPVVYGGTTHTHTIGVSGAVADELGSAEYRWREVPHQLVVWYRDPEGRSFPASIPAINIGNPAEGLRNVSFTATQVSDDE